MRRLRNAVIAAALVSASSLGAGYAQSLNRPLVIVAEFDGIIHPISAEYLTQTIDEADASSADVVVFILRTPGGLLDSTRTIVSRMIASRAPVVVLVGPSGSRAASAGFVIALAADVTVMAPGTHMGAAHPVSGTGESVDDTMAEKAASDTAAYVRSLAAARGRSEVLAEEAVLESRAFTDGEALAAEPPLIDFVAQDLDDVLRQLDGRMVTRFDGQTSTLRTANAEVRRVNMTRRQTFLGAIAHPQIATLLLTLGMLGLTIELWSPGVILPGVAGGVCLLLAFFAFQILPVSATGLLLILFGLILLFLELTVPSFGVLGIGGTISLVLGATMLTRDTIPGIEVGLGFIVPMALGCAAILLGLGRLALRSQRQRSVAGEAGMIGVHGYVREPIELDATGYIDVHGEIWRARSERRLAAGQPVRVTAVDGLTLAVEPSGTQAHEGEH
ncbi:MAG: nodulation protein NfeD [Acidobacteria bacterium]|nr:nodulation protein NfeD [Acidobacteriota bacterium]